MALLGSKKEKEAMEAAAPSAPPPTSPLPAPKPAPKPPAMTVLRMDKDGGLNGRCWRAGEMLSLPVEAADRLIADGTAHLEKA